MPSKRWMRSTTAAATGLTTHGGDGGAGKERTTLAVSFCEEIRRFTSLLSITLSTLSSSLSQSPLPRTDPELLTFKLASPKHLLGLDKANIHRLGHLAPSSMIINKPASVILSKENSICFHATFLAPKTQTSHDSHRPHQVYLLCFDL